MKALNNGGELIKAPLCVKISILLFLCVAFFLLGKHWSDISHRQELLFFSTTSTSPSVSISPNFNKFFDISSLINSSQTNSSSPNSPGNGGSSLSSLAPQKVVEVGIVSENGTMTEDFEVGEYDPTVVENWGNGTGSGNDESESRVRVRVHKFPLCLDSLREYIPCMDNEEAIRQLKSTERGERGERHCPEKGKELRCLVPAPKNHKIPIPWPRSRDEVWYFNVPHTRLIEDKGGQNWITRDKDKFKFPGRGTPFIHGADGYLDQISKMIPEIAFGRHTRVVLDVGCGVASFGAYLMSHNVITLSIAPKDVHENQIQFTLERGVPSMVAAFATHRLPYPSQAFDTIHCSRCVSKEGSRYSKEPCIREVVSKIGD